MTKSNLKFIIKIVLAILIFAGIVYCVQHAFSIPEIFITDSGVVVSKGQSCGRYHSIEYLGINFDKVGFQAVSVDMTLYMQKNIGDRISIENIRMYNETFFDMFCVLVTSWIFMVTVVISIMYFLIWLFRK